MVFVDRLEIESKDFLADMVHGIVETVVDGIGVTFDDIGQHVEAFRSVNVDVVVFGVVEETSIDSQSDPVLDVFDILDVFVFVNGDFRP